MSQLVVYRVYPQSHPCLFVLSPKVRTDIDIRADLAVLRPKESREIHRVVPGV